MMHAGRAREEAAGHIHAHYTPSRRTAVLVIVLVSCGPELAYRFQRFGK
jgi:hypothetical protein